MQELVDLARGHSAHRFARIDQALGHHVAGNAHGRRRGALSGPRLQQEQAAALHRELEVLHVPVMPLESLLRLEKLGVCLREPFLHLLDRQRCANARHHVLALRVDEELAVEPALPGRRVARERDAGARVVPEIAEDHRHDRHRRAERVGYAVQSAIVDSLSKRPRSPDGLDGAPQLARRIHREVRPGRRGARAPCTPPRDCAARARPSRRRWLRLSSAASRPAVTRTSSAERQVRRRRTSAGTAGTSRRRSAHSRSRARAPARSGR